MKLIRTNMERIKKYVEPYYENNVSFLINRGRRSEVSMIHRTPNGEYYLNFSGLNHYENEWNDNLFDEISLLILNA